MTADYKLIYKPGRNIQMILIKPYPFQRHSWPAGVTEAKCPAIRHAVPVSAPNGPGDGDEQARPDRASRGPAGPQQPAKAPPVPDGPARRDLVLETWFVQAAFLVPGFLGAVDALAAHLGGAGTIQRIPTIVAGHPLANLVLAMLTYLQVGVIRGSRCSLLR